MRITLILVTIFFTTPLQAQLCNKAYSPATTPNSQFETNDNGTVTDKQTGLMWKQCLEGMSGDKCSFGSPLSQAWNGALQIPETLNTSGGFAGYTDWRLPNIRELFSIAELQCIWPSVNLAIFPNTAETGVLWSGSAAIYPSDDTWVLTLSGGSMTRRSRNGLDYFGVLNNNYVRLVRVIE